jgi:hypothetical protein
MFVRERLYVSKLPMYIVFLVFLQCANASSNVENKNRAPFFVKFATSLHKYTSMAPLYDCSYKIILLRLAILLR